MAKESKNIINVGDIFESKKCGKFIVENMVGEMIVIKFLETGYKTTIMKHHCTQGRNVKDPYKPTVAGVGYIGEGKYKSCDENGKLTKTYQSFARTMKGVKEGRVSVREDMKNFQNYAELNNKD